MSAAVPTLVTLLASSMSGWYKTITKGSFPPCNTTGGDAELRGRRDASFIVLQVTVYFGKGTVGVEGSHHPLVCPHSMLEFGGRPTLEGGHDRRADHNLRTRQVLTGAQVMVRL